MTLKTALEKVRMKAKDRREKKNRMYEEKLEKLKMKRAAAERETAIVKQVQEEEALIKKARKEKYNASRLGRAINKTSKILYDYQKKQSKKKPPMYGGGFNTEKLKL